MKLQSFKGGAPACLDEQLIDFLIFKKEEVRSTISQRSKRDNCQSNTTCEFSVRLSKRLQKSGFHQTPESAHLKDILLSTKGNTMKVIINSLYVVVPNLTPDASNQVIFDETIESIFINHCSIQDPLTQKWLEQV